ncbi:Hypothetical protein A7982_01826 [Minicystis rosea]|nr:Hypothetical protein A7982_01826 [Minicystis rosea]
METTRHLIAAAMIGALTACSSGSSQGHTGQGGDSTAPGVGGTGGTQPADGGVDASPPAHLPNPILADLPDNTALDLGGYACDQPADDPGGCGAITDYSRFNYDPVTHRLLMFGGGHAGRTGTDVVAFDFITLKWSSLYPSVLCADMIPDNWDPATSSWKATSNGTSSPVARHTWDMMVVMDVAGAHQLVIITSGGVSGTKPETCGAPKPPFPEVPFYGPMLRYDISASTWTYGTKSMDGLFYYANAAEADPISHKIVVLGSEGLQLFDPSTESAELLTGAPSGLGYSNNLVYFPPNDRFYYIARGTPTKVFEVQVDRANPAASSITELTTTGAPHTEESGWAYDAANHVIGGGVTDGVFHALDPITRAWTSRTMAVAPADGGGAVGTVAFHALDYDPVDNVYLFLTDYASGRRTWAYRYHAP